MDRVKNAAVKAFILASCATFFYDIPTGLTMFGAYMIFEASRDPLLAKTVKDVVVVLYRRRVPRTPPEKRKSMSPLRKQ